MSFRRLVTIALVSAALGFGGNAIAGCTQESAWSSFGDPAWMHTYDGMIGKHLVRMTIVFSGDGFAGKYFYISTLKDIRIEGKFSDGRSIVITEYDEANNVSAQFKGQFPIEDPKEHYGPGNKLSCEVIVGSWEKLPSGASYPFYLNSAHSITGSIESRYAKTGIMQTDVEVERFAQRFIAAVRSNERIVVARMIHYPFNLYINGIGIRKIRNKREFISNYDSLFTDSYKTRLFGSIPKHMFIDRHGFIAIGRTSSAWIGPDMKIWPLGQT